MTAASKLELSHEDQERIIEITKGESSPALKETLWRTLISNREWDHLTDPYGGLGLRSAPTEFGARFESWFAMSRLESANPATFSDDLPNTIEDREAVYHENIETLLPPGKRPGPGLSPKEVSTHLAAWLQPFTRACRVAMVHRCFYLTEKDNMGLTPLHTCTGDIVVVLYGCALLVILRPVGGHCEFVGQAYTHGWMTGEAVDLAEKGELKEGMFEIH